MHRLIVAIALLPLLLSVAVVAAEPPAGSRYFQQVESDDGEVLTMQLAMRRFKRDHDDREVWLAAMVHIGDRTFYKSVQEKLDTLDIVLFEGVRPPGGGRAEFDLGETNDQTRIDRTKRRVRFLAIAAQVHKRAHGTLPTSADDLVGRASDRMADFVKANLTDAWGRALTLRVDQPATPEEAAKIEITSLGADGEAGGEGAAADIRFSDLPPLKNSEIPKPGEGRGLQQQLASALGLVFQLDVMKHDAPNWRSSDLSVDQIEERMGNAGANADELFQMLDGSSFTAGIAKVALGLVKLFPSAQVYGKIVLMEAMVRADDLLHISPKSMAKVLDVILNDRNAVVLSDLKSLMEKEPEHKHIGIIYGGGHMAGLEAGLAELGFKDAGVEWTDAIRLDLKAAGFTAKEAREIRNTIGKSLESQIKAAKKKAKKPRKTE